MPDPGNAVSAIQVGIEDFQSNDAGGTSHASGDILFSLLVRFVTYRRHFPAEFSLDQPDHHMQ